LFSELRLFARCVLRNGRVRDHDTVKASTRPCLSLCQWNHRYKLT
jgi:MOSC domain-containing protein YiiM